MVLTLTTSPPGFTGSVGRGLVRRERFFHRLSVNGIPFPSTIHFVPDPPTVIIVQGIIVFGFPPVYFLGRRGPFFSRCGGCGSLLWRWSRSRFSGYFFGDKFC